MTTTLCWVLLGSSNHWILEVVLRSSEACDQPLAIWDWSVPWYPFNLWPGTFRETIMNSSQHLQNEPVNTKKCWFLGRLIFVLSNLLTVDIKLLRYCLCRLLRGKLWKSPNYIEVGFAILTVLMCTKNEELKLATYLLSKIMRWHREERDIF